MAIPRTTHSKTLYLRTYKIHVALTKIVLCQYLISSEDMILALAGQFKQLSHEPEKFR